MRNIFTKAINFITDEAEFSHVTTKLMSLICLAIAAAITLKSFDTKHFFVFTGKLSITPSFLSGAVSIALLVPLYARHILKWSKSIYGLTTLFLLWTVFAAIIQLSIQGKTDIPEYLVIAAVALSWLGMRGVAGFAWILAFAACILSIVKVNTAMGGTGFLFLASAFVGCILHAGLSPAQLVEEIQSEFRGFSPDTRKRIISDMKSSRDLL